MSICGECRYRLEYNNPPCLKEINVMLSIEKCKEAIESGNCDDYKKPLTYEARKK